jgi:ABC-type uncharacterized transport system permease subunit
MGEGIIVGDREFGWRGKILRLYRITFLMALNFNHFGYYCKKKD